MDDFNTPFDDDELPIRDIDFFLNRNNVPNPLFMKDVYEYSLRKYGKIRLILDEESVPNPFFDPWNFLNCLWELICTVIKYSRSPHAGYNRLRSNFGLNESEYYLLTAFVLRWFGGTPIKAALEDFTQKWKNYGEDAHPSRVLNWLSTEFFLPKLAPPDSPKLFEYDFEWPDGEQVFIFLSIIESQFLHYCKKNNEQELLLIAANSQIIAGEVEYPQDDAITYSEELPVIKADLRLRGTKTDLIRILYALHEIRLFQKSDETLPSRKEFMEIFGTLLSVDLSDSEKVLSGLRNNTSPETNYKIFEELKSKFQPDTNYKEKRGIK